MDTAGGESTAARVRPVDPGDTWLPALEHAQVRAASQAFTDPPFGSTPIEGEMGLNGCSPHSHQISQLPFHEEEPVTGRKGKPNGLSQYFYFQ